MTRDVCGKDQTDIKSPDSGGTNWFRVTLLMSPRQHGRYLMSPFTESKYHTDTKSIPTKLEGNIGFRHVK